MKRSTMIIVGAFLMFGAVSVQAQYYAKGVAAAQSGDFATALKEWLPLSKKNG